MPRHLKKIHDELIDEKQTNTMPINNYHYLSIIELHTMTLLFIQQKSKKSLPFSVIIGNISDAEEQEKNLPMDEQFQYENTYVHYKDYSVYGTLKSNNMAKAFILSSEDKTTMHV